MVRRGFEKVLCEVPGRSGWSGMATRQTLIYNVIASFCYL